MHRLGLAPSEVRGMTLGEIYAVTWAFEMANTPRDPLGTEAQKDELYQELVAARN